MDHLIHDPQVIEYVLELARGGADRQTLIHAVNRGYGRSDVVQRKQYEFPRLVEVGPRRERPTLAWTSWNNVLAIQLSDLPAPAPALLAWVGESPVHLLRNLAPSEDGPRKDFAQHLLTSDRAYRATHPDALPVIEETPERLFAHQPEFAMLYASTFGDLCISAAMSNYDLVRTIKCFAAHSGWDFGKLKLPSQKLELSDGVFSGRTFSIQHESS
jgi:hypothetical protein